MLTLLMTSALAGYGDLARAQGVVSPEEREMHLWTNAARMSPSSFKGELDCWGDFSSQEKEVKRPLAMHLGLYEVAGLHSEEMLEKNYFAHESYDGSSMFDRVDPFYDSPYVGENIFWNPGSPWGAVLGWLCSPGHRANIMVADYTEFGGGIAGDRYTQNFGSSGRGPRAMNVATHVPAVPRAEVTLFVDAWGSDLKPVKVVVDGVAYDTKLELGTEEAGIRRLRLAVDDEACHVYWFETVSDGEAVRLPEEGGYAFGDCDYDDAHGMWLSAGTVKQYVPDEVEGGCSVAPVGAGGWLVLGGLFGLRRRRG